ncbi:MAG: lysophospholipid acyltransferase family protein [Mycobacterium sp.]
MSDTDIDDAEIAEWDPGLTKAVIGMVRPIVKRYFRSEVHGLDLLPPGGALVVSNHSGGMMQVDVLVFAVDFYDKFGYDRPLYTLAHDVLFHGPAAELLRRLGAIHATPEHAAKALHAGGVVLDFPGGYYDVYRPTLTENVIDFGGHTGYARVAIDTRVPIVPAVSIGGQENQLYLSRGAWLLRALRMRKLSYKLTRSRILPITFGFPFGLSIVLPVNMPLPTKIIAQVLPPIDLAVQFGENPDAAAVDAYVRPMMQRGLDELAAARRFPILG